VSNRQAEIQTLIALQHEYYARFGDGYPTEQTGEAYDQLVASIKRCLETGEPYVDPNKDDEDILY